MAIKATSYKNVFLNLAMFLGLFVLTFGVGDLSSLHIAHAASTVAPTACGGPQTVGGNVINTANANCGSVGIINGKIKLFAETLAGIVMGVAVLVIVYAGFRYATSNGDPKAIETAKMQIIYAGIGIVVAMLALVIVNVFTQIAG